MRVQCSQDFESNLLAGLLAWQGGPLIYTLQQKKQKKDFEISFSAPPLASESLELARKRCDWKWEKNYPDFKLIHRGRFACLFERNDDPRTVVIRIRSFQYQKSTPASLKEQIQSLPEEVAALRPYWTANSGRIRHLILDLIDNRGGNAPIDYYQLLFSHPFLEQFVEFKKTTEFEDRELRDALFWHDRAHERWFQEFQSSGEWSRLKAGEFTPPTPQFCADGSQICGSVRFIPFSHSFRGKISLMVNQNCISSCDGMVWMLMQGLHAKAYGFYSAADSAYARLRIDAIQDSATPAGFVLKIHSPRSALNEEAWVSEIVATSRSTDAQGNILSGRPIRLEKVIPERSDENYHRSVLKAILSP